MERGIKMQLNHKTCIDVSRCYNKAFNGEVVCQSTLYSDTTY